MNGRTFTTGRGVLRHSRRDALLIALALGHGALLLAVPSAAVVALGLWWNSNTVAHYFLHRPFFRSRVLNILFGLYLSLLLGIPQEVWRTRHLAHHFGPAWRGRNTPLAVVQGALVLALWAGLLAWAPRFFLTAYLPGYFVGLGLCWLHGYYEHARGTTSHYGLLYNLLFFNDGYHVEHHRRPGAHWSRLPLHQETGALGSRLPAVLRWLDALTLPGLERLVLRSPFLQRRVLGCHERAFRRLLPHLPPVRRVGIVGGGLFPRTLLILRRLLPEADCVVIDLSAESIATARPFAGDAARFVHARYDPERVHDLDLLIFPLSYFGDRQELYQRPAVPAVVVHDWLWRRRGVSAVVSVFLLKRLNLIVARRVVDGQAESLPGTAFGVSPESPSPLYSGERGAYRTDSQCTEY